MSPELFEEVGTALTLFFCVVLSNLLSRYLLRYNFRVRRWEEGAWAVTVISVAITAAVLSWTAPTVTSALFGLVFAFFVSRLPREEGTHANSSDRR